MDRNCYRTLALGGWGWSLSARRVWIEINTRNQPSKPRRSLSARRAWIEIRRFRASWSAVDTSLSARRAWIEIDCGRRAGQTAPVALRKESVDRNSVLIIAIVEELGRSPQGERG